MFEITFLKSGHSGILAPWRKDQPSVVWPAGFPGHSKQNKTNSPKQSLPSRVSFDTDPYPGMTGGFGMSAGLDNQISNLPSSQKFSESPKNLAPIVRALEDELVAADAWSPATIQTHLPWDPWDWYIYPHLGGFYGKCGEIPDMDRHGSCRKHKGFQLDVPKKPLAVFFPHCFPSNFFS